MGYLLGRYKNKVVKRTTQSVWPICEYVTSVRCTTYLVRCFQSINQVQSMPSLQSVGHHALVRPSPFFGRESQKYPRPSHKTVPR